MSIEITKETIGIWFVELGGSQDWLGAVWRTDEGTILRYRFRYYVDDKTFDSDDKKSWYEVGPMKKTEEEAIEMARYVVKMLAEKAGSKSWETLNDGDYDLFVERFTELPFNSVMKVH